MPTLFTALVVCGLAQPVDPIAKRLQDAVASVQRELEALDTRFARDLVKIESAVRRTGDREALDVAQRQRAAFEAERRPPPGAVGAHYLTLRGQILDKGIAAYRKAMADYTRSKQDVFAAKTQEDLSAFVRRAEGDTLWPGGQMTAKGGRLTSKNGKYECVVLPGGILTVRRVADRVQVARLFSVPEDADEKEPRIGILELQQFTTTTLRLLPDGELVLSKFGQEARPEWSSKTGGHPLAKLVMGDDGVLRLLERDTTLWKLSATHSR